MDALSYRGSTHSSKHLENIKPSSRWNALTKKLIRKLKAEMAQKYSVFKHHKKSTGKLRLACYSRSFAEQVVNDVLGVQS